MNRPGVTQCIPDESERGRMQAAIRIIEVVARKGWTPVREDAAQASRRDIVVDHVLGYVGQAKTFQGRLAHLRTAIEDEARLHLHVEGTAIAFELPRIKATQRIEPQSNAIVRGEITWRCRCRMRGEIAGRSDTISRKGLAQQVLSTCRLPKMSATLERDSVGDLRP